MLIREPKAIEEQSFAIIGQALAGRTFPPEQEGIIKRVIHTSADFDYADTLVFGNDPVKAGLDALREGCTVVTDTRMAYAGINAKNLARFGAKKTCYIDLPAIDEQAKEMKMTRAALSMEYAARQADHRIFAIGNAPTALLALQRLIEEEDWQPALVIGVPVGFVNVVESKELLMNLKVPYIVARGPKGGSNIAAAIVNGLMLEGLR